jgi:hypothetical protein
MKISEIMTKATVTDAADDTLAEAAARMWNAQTGSLLVMEGDHLLGIVTERDLLRAVSNGLDPKAVALKDVMRTEVITCGPQTSLKEAARVPAEVATLCAEVAALSRVTIEKGNPQVLSDAAVAVLLAYAGAHGAALNVRINLKLINDPAFTDTLWTEVRRQMEATSATRDAVMAVASERLG